MNVDVLRRNEERYGGGEEGGALFDGEFVCA